MAEVEHSGLLRPTTQPVALPWDERPTQLRRLGVWIAALIVIGSVAGGLLYKHLWEDVGHEVTRILPASTTLFVRITKPMERLKASGELDRWQDSDELTGRWRTRGLLSGASHVRVAGAQLSTVGKVLEEVEILELAAVPTPAGTTLLFFADFRSAGAARRLLQAFHERLEIVDRLLGFDIYRVNAAPPWLPWAPATSPIHATLMDGRWVVAFGPLEALEDLIEARVGGSSQPIRTRAGFDALSVARDRTGFWAHVDEGEMFDAVTEMLGLRETIPLSYRASLVEASEGVTIRNGINDGDDLVDLRLSLASTASPPWPVLRGARRTAESHGLLRRMPIDPAIVWSVSLDDSADLIDLISGLASFARRGANEDGEEASPPETGARPAERSASWPDGFASLAAVAERAGALTGDALFATTSWHAQDDGEPDGWLAVLGVNARSRLDLERESIADALMLLGWTYGVIEEPDGQLHIARDGPRAWVWRLDSDVLIASSSPRALDLVDGWHASPGPGGDERVLHRALRSLPTKGPVLVLMDPARLRIAEATHPERTSHSHIPPPWLDLLTADLQRDFRFSASLHPQDDGLVIHTNLGAWTSLAELAATDVGTLDARTIADLPLACRRAYGSMCASLNASPLCATFLPGRSQVVARACARLKVRGVLELDEEGSGAEE